MKNFFAAAIVALACLVAISSATSAAQPFNAKSFQEAQASGKTTLVHVGASWCSTCQRQKPIIRQIEQEIPELVVYEVDFDTAKDVLRLLDVRHQTTLIVFNGKREIARSVGDASGSGIRALVAAGL